MSRTAKFLTGVIATALCGVMSPAFASPATAAESADPSGPGAVQKLSAAEVKAFEQENPEEDARLKADSVRRHGGAAARGTYVRIHNKNSNKCLAIGNSSQENGAHAIQWKCLDSNAQLWYIDGHFVQNAASGKYLAIGSSSTANGAHAIQWDYTGSKGQQWTWSGEFFWNNNSGKYLAIGSSSTEDGAHALQWEYTGSDGQRWW
ncbi:RICIN domain-containing protein [Streptomyces beigongshangae]|uniref:RICIN domain-containing protein n=1 Tax=Streptomyces beigongshangae TaxID=2841597 RepID=UPI001C846E1E|nr:RICIN domain-containing protein [Streptomyces sp. REN17]